MVTYTAGSLCTDWRGRGKGGKARHRVQGMGMLPFTFDSLIILIEKLHCYTELENWNVPEGPTQ